MAKSYWSHAVVWASLAGALAGCSTVPDSRAPASPPSGDPLAIEGGNGEPVPRIEPPSRSGNPDTYRVFGRRYRVKETSEGYREQGIASWYGWDFHGRKTSSGPRYNMFDLTAAHKSLPIPTYVRVTNLENGRNVVVKVNDRGPFVGRRIIDLSYAAADRLGMLGQGTAQVEVAALEPYQSLPELAARRAESRERLASRQSRPESKSEPTAIEFAREEPIRLAASDLSRSPLSRSDLVAVRAETPEPSANRLSRPESKSEPAAIQVAREEPMGPLAPEPSRSDFATARAETPKPLASRPIPPEPKSEPAVSEIAREDSVPPPVVDTPSMRPVKATVAERGAVRTRAPARPAAPAVVRAAPKATANPVIAKSPAKSGQESRVRSPIRLASAETALKGKTAGEQRRSPVSAGGKSDRFDSAVTPAGRRDGRFSGERSSDVTRRDARKLSDSANRQETRAPARESGAAKPAVRLAGLRAGRHRTAID